MSEKKILVVFGATGIQGGSVIQSILGDEVTASQFALRAVTRDVSKPAAQLLVAQGVDVVVADFNDKASLLAALKGAYAVYLVTDFWSVMSKETEITHGENVTDAAIESNIQHLIFSSLPSATTLSNGLLTNVYHFDSKSVIETYIRSLNIPSTFLLPGFYMNNLPGQRLSFNPTAQKWTLALPMPSTTRLPLFAAEFDTGKFVKAILSNRDTMLGKRVFAATAYTTPTEIVEMFKECFSLAGKNAEFVEMKKEEFEGLLSMYGIPEVGRQDLGEMMELFGSFGYFGGENLENSLAILTEPLTTWREYMLQAESFKGLE